MLADLGLDRYGITTGLQRQFRYLRSLEDHLGVSLMKKCLDWSFKPSIPYASYRLFHLYHVSLDTPNAMQTSDIVLPERSGSIIILYLFSISTCFTLQDWSVNYVRKLKCRLCMEAAHLALDELLFLLLVLLNRSHYSHILHISVISQPYRSHLYLCELPPIKMGRLKWVGTNARKAKNKVKTAPYD